MSCHGYNLASLALRKQNLHRSAFKHVFSCTLVRANQDKVCVINIFRSVLDILCGLPGSNLDSFSATESKTHQMSCLWKWTGKKKRNKKKPPRRSKERDNWREEIKRKMLECASKMSFRTICGQFVKAFKKKKKKRLPPPPGTKDKKGLKYLTIVGEFLVYVKT